MQGAFLVLLHLLLAEVEVEELLQVLMHLLLPEVEVEVKGEVAEGDMQALHSGLRASV